MCVYVFMWLYMCSGVSLPEHRCGIRGHTRCQSSPPIVWRGLWCFYACQALWPINLQGFHLSPSVETLANFACKFDWIKEWLGVSQRTSDLLRKSLEGFIGRHWVRGGLWGVLLCCPGSFLYPLLFSTSCLLRRKDPAPTYSHLCDTLHDPTGSGSHGPNLLKSCAKQILPLRHFCWIWRSQWHRCNWCTLCSHFISWAVLGGIPLVPRSRLALSHDFQCERFSGHTPEVELQNTRGPQTETSWS